jgi:hypothetical protein
MSRWNLGDTEVQCRLYLLSRLLCLDRKRLLAKFIREASVVYSPQSVYRMLMAPGSAGRQPWSEPVARALIRVLEATQLTRPDLWERLFRADVPAELAAGSPPHFVIPPSARAIQTFVLGVRLSAERRATRVRIVSALLPPQLSSPAIDRLLGFAGATVRPEDHLAAQRAVRCYGNLCRRLTFDLSPCPQTLFVAEETLRAVLFGTGVFSTLSVGRRAAFAKGLGHRINQQDRLQVGLFDLTKLNRVATSLIRAKTHTFVWQQSDCLLYTVWPCRNAAIHCWTSSDSGGVPLLDDVQLNAIEGAASALTHPAGNDGFLDRLARLTHKAGLTRDSWL